MRSSFNEFIDFVRSLPQLHVWVKDKVLQGLSNKTEFISWNQNRGVCSVELFLVFWSASFTLPLHLRTSCVWLSDFWLCWQECEMWIGCLWADGSDRSSRNSNRNMCAGCGLCCGELIVYIWHCSRQATVPPAGSLNILHRSFIYMGLKGSDTSTSTATAGQVNGLSIVYLYL